MLSLKRSSLEVGKRRIFEMNDIGFSHHGGHLPQISPHFPRPDSTTPPSTPLTPSSSRSTQQNLPLPDSHIAQEQLQGAAEVVSKKSQHRSVRQARSDTESAKHHSPQLPTFLPLITLSASRKLTVPLSQSRSVPGLEGTASGALYRKSAPVAIFSQFIYRPSQHFPVSPTDLELKTLPGHIGESNIERLSIVVSLRPSFILTPLSDSSVPISPGSTNVA